MRSLIALKSSRSKTTSASLRAVPVRAGDLARERLVEVAAVVQAGERVEVGELPGFAEAARVLDRGPRALRELLELADLLLGESVLAAAAVDRQEPDRARMAGHRHGQPGPDQVSRVQRGRVLVDERDRARLLAVGRSGDDLALRLLLGEPERRHDRLLLAVDRDESCVDTGHGARGLERPREHLVEVDRAGQLGQVAVAAAFLLCALQGQRELAHHRLHAGVHLADELEQLLLAPAAGTASAQHQAERDQQDHRDGHPGDYQGSRVRHRIDHLSLAQTSARARARRSSAGRFSL